MTLCTSGSAAANLHPAVAEADEAGVPLIVLTADRPPELRGIGVGPDDRPAQALRLGGALVLRGRHPRCRRRGTPSLPLGRLPRATRPRAASRDPGPVHLNVPWREPLAPVAPTGRRSPRARRSLAGAGADGPLTAVSAPARGAAAKLLDRLAERIAELGEGLIVAGRQTDPGLAPVVASLAAASGYPILPEPTSQLRLGGHDRSRVIWAYDSIARARPESLAPDLVLRFGDMPTSKSLREWIRDREPEQFVLAPHGWNEPTHRADRDRPRRSGRGRGGTRRPARVARKRPARRSTGRRDWLRAGERPRGRSRAELAGESEP